MKDFYTLADLENWDAPAVRLGVIGYPVAHSRSPQMMNAALAHCGLPHRYARFQLAASELAPALEIMRTRDFIGLNVTLPHKAAALSLMDWVDEPAQAIGALNVIAIRHGVLRGSNTDTPGFARAVREEFGRDVRELRVLILGAGGAARAIAAACEEPVIWSRREQSLTQLREKIRSADLIANATPVGLQPGDAPLLTRDAFRVDQCLYDTTYTTPQSALMREAAAAGAEVANGLSMLLHQGALAFEIWFNQVAPLEVMRAALRL